MYTDSDDDVDECICNQFLFLNWRLPPLCPVGSNDNETLYLLIQWFMMQVKKLLMMMMMMMVMMIKTDI